MIFHEIDILDKEIFNKYLGKNEEFYSDYLASEVCFENLFIWNIHNNIELSQAENVIYLKANFGGVKFYLPPIVKDEKEFVKAVNELYFMHKKLDNGEPFRLKAFSKKMVEILGKSDETAFKIRTSLDRNNSDYIYNTEEFCSFKGKKLHAKRNHINNFLKNYKHEIKEYTAEKRADLDYVLNKWVLNGGELDNNEKIALNRALAHFDELGLKGIIVYVLGEPVAFSIGKISVFNVGYCFFEKANIEYSGIFSFISNLFAKTFLNGTRFINRQEDMGIEGLRKSKLSYNPVFLFEKYSIEEE